MSNLHVTMTNHFFAVLNKQTRDRYHDTNFACVFSLSSLYLKCLGLSSSFFADFTKYHNNLTISHITRCFVEFVSHNIIYQDIDKSMAWCVIDLSKNKETVGKAWQCCQLFYSLSSYQDVMSCR